MIRTGATVAIRVSGQDQWHSARVELASENGRSLALVLDCLLPGLDRWGVHPDLSMTDGMYAITAGPMILLFDDGEGYRDLATDILCEVREGFTA